MQVISLEYSETMLNRLRRGCSHAPGFIWLDSSSPWTDPDTHANEHLLFNPDWRSAADTDLLPTLLARCTVWERPDQQHYILALRAKVPELRFHGGLAGALPYSAVDHSLPGYQAVVGDYRNFIEIQHDTRRIFAVVTDQDSHDLLLRMRDPSHAEAGASSFSLTSDWQWQWRADDYEVAFERIQAYLAAGDCYQVNLTQRCQAGYQGKPFEAYWQLRQMARAPFSAYVDLGEGHQSAALLSFSPERFLRIENGRMLASPIKGTRARLSDTTLDRQQRESLSASEKDRAENLMIVDLLRNDISRYAKTGSVRVPELFALHSFSNVHHLISHVTAELDPTFHPLDALLGCFPGGSITGAPKQRAREIIDELEGGPRGYYCGTVFSFSRNGLLDSNIAIRSVHCANGLASISGGGGITTGSMCSTEYAESVDKIRHLMEGLSRL